MVLGKLFGGLRKTRERVSKGLSRLLGGGRQLDEALLDELEEALYTADLGPVGSELVDELKEAYRRKEVRETVRGPALLARAVSWRGSTAARHRARPRRDPARP